MEDLLAKWWAAILSAIGGLVWLVRLEARAAQNSRDLARLEERLRMQRSEDMAARQRDHEALLKRLDETRDDIRDLRAEIKAAFQRP